jgi:precorrin-3B C17-methyltransferase
MAGLVLENLKGESSTIRTITIIPGITAASAAASIVGAPLMNDFAVISLSDILTDTQIIETRLSSALDGDFVIVLYNPKSKKRQVLLKKAFTLIKQYRNGTTPVAIVRNAYRQDQKVRLLKLQDVDPDSPDIDMFTTIIVGNSSSLYKNGWFVTLRGYKKHGKNNTK